MEYIELGSQKHYKECQKIVSEFSYAIVELNVVPQKTQTKISIVITHSDSANTVGINDCSKAHRQLLPYFENALKSEDLYMEVTSPGMERTLKNAGEFTLFVGKHIKVWYTEVSDWISGTIKTCNEKSVTLEIQQTGEQKEFTYETIAKAKLLGEV